MTYSSGPLNVSAMAPGPSSVTVVNNTLLDGTGHANASSGSTLAPVLTTTAAGVVLVAFHTNQFNTTVTSVVGSSLGAFTFVGSAATGSNIQTVWLYAAVSNGAVTTETITITLNQAQTFMTAIAWGVKGAVHTSVAAALDSNGSLPATVNTNTPVVLSTSNAADFIFAAYYDSSDTATPGSGWTTIDPAGSYNFLLVEYKTPPPTTTQSGLSATYASDTVIVGIGHAVVST